VCPLVSHLQVAGCLHDRMFCAGSTPCSATIENWLLAYTFLTSQGLCTGVPSWVFPKLSAAATYGRKLVRLEAQDEPSLLHAIQQRNRDELLSRDDTIEFISSWSQGGDKQVSCIFQQQALPAQGRYLLALQGMPASMHALCTICGWT